MILHLSHPVRAKRPKPSRRDVQKTPARALGVVWVRHKLFAGRFLLGLAKSIIYSSLNWFLNGIMQDYANYD